MVELIEGCKPILNTLWETERKLIIDTLGVYEWDLTKSSKSLGIGRATIYRKIKAYGLKRPKARFSHE